ncbi:MAG: hypothetical protein ABJD11_11960 [Gemmatimonadota bacterium]
MFDYSKIPLPPRRKFVRRLVVLGRFSLILVSVSLCIGTLGFHLIGRISWLDAFLNSCMLIGGMGPTASFDTPASKLFASFFALYAGLVFLVAGGIVFAPLFHRLLHRFHIEDSQQPPKS